MKRRTVNSQLTNFKTYRSYKDKMLTLAENVFQFKNMNPFIDMARVNRELVESGSIAFFYDDVMGLLALPYRCIDSLDIYGRPVNIKPIPFQGLNYQDIYNRVLTPDEYVIMYDNNSKRPIFPTIIQSAERLALIKRTIDVNISQQSTPRFWRTSEENKRTINDVVNEIDAMQEVIITYDNNLIEDTNCILAPAPYVADKLNQDKKEEWSEFLELIGISNIGVQKRERVIRDEIQTSMGGTIASRYTRFESRRKAVEEINKKFNQNIEVEFYDGLPSTIEDVDMFLDTEESNNIIDNKEEVVSDVTME